MKKMEKSKKPKDQAKKNQMNREKLAARWMRLCEKYSKDKE